MKKCRLFLILMFVLMLSVNVRVKAGTSAETDRVSASASALTKIPLTKTGWYRDTDGSLYYIKENHELATGLVKINGYQYYFSSQKADKGKLFTGVRKIHGKEYYFLEEGKKGVLGRAANGWVDLERGRCYCKNGRILKNQYVDDYYVGKDGAMSEKSKALYTLVCKAIEDNTSDGMTKWEKLQACYLWLRGSAFVYSYRAVDKQSASWKMDAAYSMLTTHHGVCYHFATSFAFIARELGFENVKVFAGKIWSLNGPYYSAHGWVEMTRDGKQYIFDISQERHQSKLLLYYNKTYAQTGRTYVKLS